MDIKSVREYLGKDWEAVKEKIETSLMSDIALLNATNSSILSNSGKQLRPLLALLVARACSGHQISEATIRYAAAAELLHNATLLHDDVADNSDQRRGVPTIMSLMGPSVSVLVGDYWLVKAMEMILGSSEEDHMVTKIFSKTLSDLAEGEMLQLQKAQNGDTVQDDYARSLPYIPQELPFRLSTDSKTRPLRSVYAHRLQAFRARQDDRGNTFYFPPRIQIRIRSTCEDLYLTYGKDRIRG